MAKEIERKFLIEGLTEAQIAAKCQPNIGQNMDQFYLISEKDIEVRVRCIENIFDSTEDGEAYLTVKTGSGLTRIEHETDIGYSAAIELLEDRISNVIAKTRYMCDRWEIDVYHSHNTGLIVAEIELTSEDEFIDFPDWLTPYVTKEVTDDPTYKNKNLALN